MRQFPHLYEANARIVLRRISEKYQKKLTLATLPDEEWMELKRQGMDLIWLMGVWQRSPGARKEALAPSLKKEYEKALPDFKPSDIDGSPYAIYGYQLDSNLGAKGDLPELRKRLNRLGLGLILDFIPNHVASDHPWTRLYPDRFIHHQDANGKMRIAHGKDPYLPPWSDTAQLNLFSPSARRALIEELKNLVQVCDGVRCDMAMLALNRIFREVWKGHLMKTLPEEFWAGAIREIKKSRRDFLFLAESYWNTDWELQQLGFDYTYDKVLYDRLCYNHASQILEHLRPAGVFQEKSIHFIENHDEERAVTALGRHRSLAAALIIATIPGLRFFHDGQGKGRTVRLPIQLVREPHEPIDPGISHFYRKLLKIVNEPIFHEGTWQIHEVKNAAPGNQTAANLLAWSWRQSGEEIRIIINYSAAPAQGWISIGGERSRPADVILKDELTDETYLRVAKELNQRGIYVDLEPWRSHVFRITGKYKHGLATRS